VTTIRATMARAFADAAALGHPWALVGGLAVSARVEPRLTRDVDLAFAVDGDPAAEQIVRDLLGRGYEMVAGIEHRDTGRLATVRLRPFLQGAAGALVDLLFASSGIESEIAARAEILEILPGMEVPVATVPDLIAMKVLARDDRTRPQDHDDLVALLAAANDHDVAEAGTALDLIAKRGYSRDKSLREELRTLVARTRARQE
jgi:predicted nucleotidyltransferase